MYSAFGSLTKMLILILNTMLKVHNLTLCSFRMKSWHLILQPVAPLVHRSIRTAAWMVSPSRFVSIFCEITHYAYICILYTSIEIDLYTVPSSKHLSQLHMRFTFVVSLFIDDWLMDCINRFNNNFLMPVPVVPELRWLSC